MPLFQFFILLPLMALKLLRNFFRWIKKCVTVKFFECIVYRTLIKIFKCIKLCNLLLLQIVYRYMVKQIENWSFLVCTFFMLLTLTLAAWRSPPTVAIFKKT